MGLITCLVVTMLFVQAANERHVVLLLLLCRRSLVADWLIDPSVGRQQHKLYGYVMPVLSNMKAIAHHHHAATLIVRMRVYIPRGCTFCIRVLVSIDGPVTGVPV